MPLAVESEPVFEDDFPPLMSATPSGLGSADHPARSKLGVELESDKKPLHIATDHGLAKDATHVAAGYGSKSDMVRSLDPSTSSLSWPDSAPFVLAARRARKPDLMSLGRLLSARNAFVA